MRKVFFFAGLLLNVCFAQNSTTSISNIINSYTPVISLNACNTITVADASAINIGDTVLIMQMKGAIADSSNTAAFGSIISYENAGNYEFNYVQNMNGNILGLKNKLERQYNIPGGIVQLIRVPFYQNALVTGTLTCLPWDGSVGGVLAFNVAEDISLQADINVSGKGFRGGTDPYSNPSVYYCYEDNYYYPADPDLASEKGEGIAIISRGKSFGKGALANAGGGGNSHNSGGGGGGNAAAGGFGGYQYEGSPCNSIVPFDNRGTGGNALMISNAANRVFLGGGGGAGQSNNPQQFHSLGANGGGIIIISSNQFHSNNFKLLANGFNGASCGASTAGCHEGMGGGGGGGSCLLNIAAYADNTSVESKGGKGADMTASGFLRVAPGGGGGGGVVWTSTAATPFNLVAAVSGGANGVCTAYSNVPWGAEQGQNGFVLNGLKLPVDTLTYIDTCSTTPVTITSFYTTVADHKKIVLHWFTDNEINIQSYTIERAVGYPTGFASAGTLAAVGFQASRHYTFTDESVIPGQTYYYRLQIHENDGSEKFSAIRTVVIKKNTPELTLFPNPASGLVSMKMNHFSGTAVIRLVDNAGRQVLSKEQLFLSNIPATLDIRILAKGTYWMTIQTATGNMMKRLVKL